MAHRDCSYVPAIVIQASQAHTHINHACDDSQNPCTLLLVIDRVQTHPLVLGVQKPPTHGITDKRADCTINVPYVPHTDVPQTLHH